MVFLWSYLQKQSKKKLVNSTGENYNKIMGTHIMIVTYDNMRDNMVVVLHTKNRMILIIVNNGII